MGSSFLSLDICNMADLILILDKIDNNKYLEEVPSAAPTNPLIAALSTRD